MIRFAPSMCCEVNTVCNDVCVLHRFNFVGYIGTYSECSRHWCVYGFFPFCFPVSCMHLFVQSRNTVLNVTVPEYQTAKAQKEREREKKHIRIKDEVSSEFFYVLSVFVLLLWLSTSHINLKQRETIPNKNAHKQNAISSCFLLLLFYFVLLLSLSFDLFIYFSPTQMPLCVFFFSSTEQNYRVERRQLRS